MRMEDIQGMRIGGRDVTEVKLGGKVVWPMNVETYEAVAVSQYYYLNGNPSMANYIPANGSGYVIYAIRLMYYLNGVRDSSKDVILRAQSVNFTSSGAQGQTWTRTYSGGDILVGVNSREKNEDTSNTSITLSITASYNGVTYTKDGLRAYQQMNQKTILSSTPTITAVHPSVTNNTTYTSSSPCPASGSGSGYAQIGCKVSITDVKQVSFTSGATDTESVPRATQTTLANSEYTCAVTSGRGVISGKNFSFPTMGDTPYNDKVSSVVSVSVNGTAFSSSLTFWQAKNVKGTPTSTTYSLTLSANAYTSRATSCPAAGGSTSLNVSCTKTAHGVWSSGAPYDEGQTPTGTISFSSVANSGLTISGTTASWADRQATIGPERSKEFYAIYKESNVTKANSSSITLYQEENEETGSTTTYSLSSAISITASGTPTRASGGSSSSNYWTIGSNSVIRSVKKTYTSNYNAPATTTNMGAPTYSTGSSGLNVSGSKVWWDSMGTTPYSSGRSGSFVAKYNGSQVGSAKSVTQALNKVESTSYNHIFTIDVYSGNFSVNESEHYFEYVSYEEATPTYSSGAQGATTTRDITPTTSSSGFSVNGDLIYISANNGQSNRSGVIRSQGTNGTKTITITQTYQQVYLRFGSTTYTASYNTSTIYVSVESNINWTLTTPSSSFATGSTSGQGNRNQIPITLQTNYGSTRSVTITLQGTGSNSELTASATITQTAYTGQWIGQQGQSSHRASFGADDMGYVLVVPIRLNGNATLQSSGDTGWYQMITPLPINASTSAVRFRCIEPNETGADRSAVIRFKVSGQDDLVLTLTQRYN